MHNSVKHAVFAGAMALVALSTASAQQTSAGPKWQAWLGCWTSAPAGESYGSAQFAAPVVCITPTSNADIVEVATLADGKVVKRDSIDASGREKAILSKGCEGSQLARWSADERRVYLKTASSCDGMRSTAIPGRYSIAGTQRSSRHFLRRRNRQCRTPLSNTSRCPHRQRRRRHRRLKRPTSAHPGRRVPAVTH